MTLHAPVLVADDDPAIIALVERLLAHAGYGVVTCDNGCDALERLRRGDIRLAILDWDMPRLTGPEVCRELQKVEQLALIHILMLTGRDEAQNLEDALASGASDFLSKPFRPWELLASIGVASRIVDLQVRLLQSQKLESIGQLASGVAHELNTPIQFISDNTHFLADALAKLDRLMAPLSAWMQNRSAGGDDLELLQEVEAAFRTVNLEYLRKEMPAALQQSLDGLEHVTRIVRAMKDFAHPDGDEKQPTSLNRNILAAVLVAKNEWKYVAEVETDLDESIPDVACHPGDINQVFLNLLVNAAHAIADRADEGKGTISVRTRREGDCVEVRITDSGTGVPEHVRNRIFDPFFTTKEVGKGTGQGLAIAHAAVVDRHGGTIRFETEMGQGTTFIVRLPIDGGRTSSAEPSHDLADDEARGSAAGAALC